MTTGAVTPGEAAGMAWDVAVVGAGPAGSVMASLCAGAGARTLLIERSRFPREKVCGGCLGARGAAIVENLLGAGALARLGAPPLRRLTLRAGTREAALRLAGGVAISRATLDAALVARAERAGARTLFGAAASLDPSKGDDARTLTLADGSRIRSRIVVGADGLAGRLLEREPGMGWRIARRSRMGAGCLLPDAPHACAPGEVVMCVGRAGYVGLTRLEDGALCVACAIDPDSARHAGGPAPLAATILSDCAAPALPGLLEARWRGTPALTRARRVAGRRVLAIGDGAGYAEPFTGEGMTWALESALLAAPIALEGARAWRLALERAWLRRHARALGRRRRACRVISGALRRPALLHVALRAMAIAPELGESIATTLHARRAPA